MTKCKYNTEDDEAHTSSPWLHFPGRGVWYLVGHCSREAAREALSKLKPPTIQCPPRWVPPYVPWFCLRFLPDFFSCPCCHCPCTKGVQALGSVKRLETIVLLWRYMLYELNLFEFILI